MVTLDVLYDYAAIQCVIDPIRLQDNRDSSMQRYLLLVQRDGVFAEPAGYAACMLVRWLLPNRD